MIEKEDKVTPIRSVQRKSIQNYLNGCHFQKIPLLVVFCHKDHGFDLTLKAIPSPAYSSKATACWEKKSDVPTLAAYTLDRILLPFGKRSYEILPDKYKITDSGIEFDLPERSMETSLRRHVRYACSNGMQASLTQHSLVFYGQIIDFSFQGMLVILEGDQHLDLQLFSNSSPTILSVLREGKTVYSSAVTVENRKNNYYFLRPNFNDRLRYSARKHRARRQKLTPSPLLVYDHPITGQQHSLKICDLSSLGFSVEENAISRTLTPGLVLTNAKIYFGSVHLLTCLTQVIYSQTDKKNPGIIKSGITILDVPINEHSNMMGMLQQVQNSQVYYDGQVDLEDLFEFFFESGFIYPAKFKEILRQKEAFKQTYSALYQHDVDIERHFIYQEAGKIQGHLSALRLYRKTWINHHHAALDAHRAGLNVLQAISEYQNDSYHLNSANIKYIIAYYRPDNKFPRRFFGRYAKNTKDLSMVSEDTLGYFYNVNAFRGAQYLPEGYVLDSATSFDIKEFTEFYRKSSGGMLQKALDLTPEYFEDREIEKAYQDYGLSHSRKVYALREKGRLKALVDMQCSDLGLNLSEITNAITFYFSSTSPCQLAALQATVFSLANKYEKWQHPVMIYPNDEYLIPELTPDKEYVLWVLNIAAGSPTYMDWLYRFCR